jgi:hypothetical protein
MIIRKIVYTVIFLILLSFIFSAANYEAYRSYKDQPEGTKYYGAIGFFFDYYQFLSWIRDGRNGQILINSRYIPQVEKPVLLHPFFPLVGLATKPFGLSLPLTYHLVRNLALGFFLYCLYEFIREFLCQSQKSKVKSQNDKSKLKTYLWFLNKLNIQKAGEQQIYSKKPKTDHQVIFVVFCIILFVSSFPKISFIDGKLALSPIIDFWKTFYPLERFSIPPHHLLADGIFLLILGWIIGYFRDSLSDVPVKLKMQNAKLELAIQKSKIKNFFFPLLLSFFLVLLNPGIAVFLLLVVGVFIFLVFIRFLYRFMKREKQVNVFGKVIFIFIFVAIAAIPYIIYLNGIFKTGNPWKYFYEGEKVGRYLVSQWEYILSLGPFFFSAFLSLIYIKKFQTAHWLLLIWLVLPVILFPYVGRQIPIAMSRLFSYNVFIPAGLLTVWYFQNNILGPATCESQKSSLYRGTQFLGTLTRITQNGIMIIVVLFLLISNFGGIWVSYKDVFGFKPTFYYNVFLPKDLEKALDFVDKNDARNMTVLAGENVSNLVPVFTDMHAANGRRDAHADWVKSIAEVDEMMTRKLSDGELSAKMDAWRVKYLIFGIDHITIEEFMKKGDFPVKEVFRSGNVVVGEYHGNSKSK